jgi:CheY-like chemotaxis protein
MNARVAILIIEDDADVWRAARIVLTPLAARTETITSPRELAALLTATLFDVVPLDMNFVSGERRGREGLGAPDEFRWHTPAGSKCTPNHLVVRPSC